MSYVYDAVGNRTQRTDYNGVVMLMVQMITAITVLLTVGVLCLWQAKRMQRRAIAAGAQLKFNPFRKFIESRNYVIAVRLLGVTCILVALLLTFVIIKW